MYIIYISYSPGFFAFIFRNKDQVIDRFVFFVQQFIQMRLQYSDKVCSVKFYRKIIGSELLIPASLEVLF